MTIPTCMGCGAMGRAARCDGECSEHRLDLVSADDFDAVCDAGRVAHATIVRLDAVRRRLAETPSDEQVCEEAYRQLREAAAATLAGLTPHALADGDGPSVRTGWWCATCGNVDAPEPCLGICIWRATEWVNLDVYAAEDRRTISDRRHADALVKLARDVLAVTPRRGRYLDNWRALQIRLG
ncbi:hypothetical protein [Baekduia soli]|uniref:hypothetical protein n=1 Tax=Baekduia soli TaxID=496014 RepID=UPI001651FC4A|nr:hypothetical protein [Baekduia soli]